MGQPIGITRDELSASELRALAVRTSDGSVVRRVLAVALVMEGHSRTEAAEWNGMTRQTLRNWVHRYNAAGVSGLGSRVSPGRPPLLSDAQKAELRALVIEGPDPERHQVVRWRCVDLCAEIAERWSVRVGKQTMGKWLRQLKNDPVTAASVSPEEGSCCGIGF